MAGHLTGKEYQELLDDIASGKAEVSVTRHTARYFFMRVSAKEVSSTLGQSVIPQKILVLGSLLLSILFIAWCLYLIFIGEGWLAMFTVPLIGVFWTVIVGFTTEYGSWLTSTGLLIAALVLAWFLPATYQLPLAAFALSVYSYRVGHMMAQFFLKRIVTSSYRAWDMLAEHIDITRHAG